MSRSYEDINYSLRPAKNIERKMLCEALRRLSPFGKVESYRYIGFGSTYFTDFSLFHKGLGIVNMISIERDVDNEERFLFNVPFKCVRMQFGESTSVLPSLSWDTRTIIWLDYDGKLDSSALADVKFFCSNASSGSVIVVSVNAHPEPFHSLNPEERPAARLAKLRRLVGQDKVPVDVEGKGLTNWGLASVCHRIICNEIDETLSERNAGRFDAERFLYKQLFHFRYQDGARMLTTGGVVHDAGQDPQFAACSFDDLDFVRTGDGPYGISVPNLTYRELRHLDAQLPTDDEGKLHAPGVREADLRKYVATYRWFPHFTEAEF